MFIVTIDTGTTNTRARLWRDKMIIAQSSQSVGVRDTAITGSKAKLSHAVKCCLLTVLEKGHVGVNDKLIIVASGMITSNVGLYEIPHLTAPISQQALADAMVKKILPDITHHPIWFIPGVKNNVEKVNIGNCEAMDMMRGEEVEAIGVLSLLQLNQPALIVLPGSHSKFVRINHKNEITGCATTLAGELIDIITQHTILSSSLNHEFASSIDETYLLKGAEHCRKVGMTRSCFAIRILDLFNQLTINQKANFLLGIILYSDIQAMKNSQALNCDNAIKIVICGKKILRAALTLLIQKDDFFTGEITEFSDDDHPPLSAIGAITLINQLLLTGKTL